MRAQANQNDIKFVFCMKKWCLGFIIPLMSPINSSKGFIIMKECSRKLIIFARNNMKQRKYFHFQHNFSYIKKYAIHRRFQCYSKCQ